MASRGKLRHLKGSGGIMYRGSAGGGLGMALGGLGTSTMEIGRDGAFRNIRLQNEWTFKFDRPAPEASFLSVYARSVSGETAGRVLQLSAPEGLDAVESLTYTGRFPFTELDYGDKGLPCEVSLEAFSPFVPHDAASSSIPVIFFTLRLRNPGKEPIEAAAAMSWTNDISIESHTRERPWPAGGNRNSAVVTGGEPAVLMETRAKGIEGSQYLLSCLPSGGVRYSAVSDWWKGPEGRRIRSGDIKLRGGAPSSLWKRFLEEGKLPGESGHDDGLGAYSPHRPAGAVAGKVRLEPGEEKEVRFGLAWFFPFHRDRPGSSTGILLGHKYAERFPGGVLDLAGCTFPDREALRRRSMEWRRLIENSSLPPCCRALMTEILYLLPRISWWLKDGTFVLYESIDCPWVGNSILDIYVAPVLAALFPELHAGSLRTVASFQLDNGEIPTTLGMNSVHNPAFRLFNPSDACVFPIITAWEMLWNGDPEFAGDMYPVMKKVLQWGERELDMDGDGIVDVHGIDQGWDTFPMHGAAAYIADQWIAALLAGEKVARRFNDEEFADWCAGVRQKACELTENVLWNGEYYNLAHDKAAGWESDICFADQLTYGTVPAGILELGDIHPGERVRKCLESIWRLNVSPAKFVCRMGSHRDGKPADCTILEEQQGRDSQSNSFTPANTAPLASAAVQHGMVDEGLELIEDTADFIINRVKEPWSGQLLFGSGSGRWFYGVHYSDCLVLWDVMYALLGVHIDMFDRAMKIAPPRIPVNMPVFGKLYYGSAAFSLCSESVELLLESFSEKPSLIRTLTVKLPGTAAGGKCSVVEGSAGGVVTGESEETVLSEVIVPPKGKLLLRWGLKRCG